MTNASYNALVKSLLARVVMYGKPNVLGSSRAPASTYFITDKHREAMLAQAIQDFVPFKARPVRDDGSVSIPFAAITVTPNWSEKDVARAVLHELCYPTDRRTRLSDLVALLKQAIVRSGVRVLHLASAHNLVSGDPRRQSQLTWLLKELRADDNTPLRMIFSGQPSLKQLLVDDPQLPRRSNVVDLTTNIVRLA